MKRPRVLALLCAWQWCVTCTRAADTAYPKFQCYGSSFSSLSLSNAQKWYKTRKCDADTCQWQYGKRVYDKTGTRDCENCPWISEDKLEAQEDENRWWICPRHCAAMPQMTVEVPVDKTTKSWTVKHVTSGCVWDEKNNYYYCATTQNAGADISDPTTRTASETIYVTLPGARCTSSGENCHRFNWKYTDYDAGREDPPSQDANTYSIRRVSQCKTLRYNSNYNERILSCRKWKPPGDYPTMVHFNDNFWVSDPKDIHALNEFSGVKTNKKTILQCSEINSGIPSRFQRNPCWKTTPNNALHFSIKPFYTAYRNSARKASSDPADCRMIVHGDSASGGGRWSESYFKDRSNQELPASKDEWKAETYWEPRPETPYHTYKWKSMISAVKAERGDFYNHNYGETKTFSYNIGCADPSTSIAPAEAHYYESGCTAIACIDFMTKPCYDNVYRYDEMVCNMIQYIFPTEITFQKFTSDIVPETDYRDPFMAYGRYPSTGPSYFEISFDNTKVEVRKNNAVIPPGTVNFIPTDTILVALKPLLSCNGCRDKPLHGRVSTNEAVLLHNIIGCRQCLLYEKISAVSNYQDCKLCPKHQVRNSNDPAECRKCLEIDALTPMRRAAPHPQTDAQCTTCQHFQYFDENTAQGCEFLKTVTDGIVVTNNKAVLSALSGKDYYIKDENRKEIDAQFYRDKILTTTPWNRELVPQACSPGYNEPVTLVKRLKFTAWCAHQEMVRHQQAWLQVDGSSLYVPLNSDQARTRSNTSVVELCGGNALTQVRGSTTADLQCGSYKFLIIRSGFQDPCTLCLGAKFTQNCWPTYVPGLEVYDEQYFLRGNAALTPQPGTCGTCKPVCDKYLEPDHYIDPVEYSCWWNGIGRIPGVLGSTDTNFSWYKQAPCTKCNNVQIAADTAELVLACGNRVSYRRWLADTVTGSEDDPTRSIPSIQVCCVQPAGLCTSTPAEFETFALQKCTQTVEDTTPAFLPYCPPFWYVNPACAKESPLWNPDCCVKCKSCRGGKFKTDAYYDCPGDQYFDSQDRGCTTSCLTNQYLRNERCIKCEACE